MIRGFCNGVFDGMHNGHRNFLIECAKRCNTLIVALNSDASVKRLKGPGRPNHNWVSRSHAVDILLGDHRDQSANWFDTEEELAAMPENVGADVIFKSSEYADFSHPTIPVVFIPRTPGVSTTGGDK